MARLTLTLFGGFRAHLDPGVPLAFPTRKAQALLSYLAMPPGQVHPRDKLASLLWGSTVETTARTSLRQTLYSLRRSLQRADREPLHADGNTVSLDPGAVAVDVVEFERRVAEGGPSALADAAALYQGDLLEGLTVQEAPFEDWLLAQRERLHEVALRALVRLFAHQRATGSTESAIQSALRLLTLDALQEPVHRALMQLYVETGRRSAALRQYRLCVTTLQRELNTAPEKETTALYEEILRERVLSVPLVETGRPTRVPEQVLNSRSALEGERKHVTVLFADLKASMQLLAHGDPEDARKLLDPVLERMMEAVRHYEGTVNQVMVDGIMALFGAPIAQEDHAVRACFAALRMQELVRQYAEETRDKQGVNIQIQVGLDSGEVVVRAIGSDVHMDYTAVGQTTHLASRMEELARPGGILLTRSTLELAEGYVSVKPLGPMHVKGLADAVEVYEITGAGLARTRLQAAARRGLTRFVGRNEELEQLRRAQQLARARHGQVLAVVGEPGVGKSRLIYEFIQSQALQGWRALEGEALSYGKATSYLPVIDLLKGFFSIPAREEPREIREKVTGRLLMLDRALGPTLPALLALFDVPADDGAWSALSPGQRRERTLDAVRRLLLREAREQPLVVILEDLHWIDGETQAVLDTLVDSLGSSRLLLIVSYRPEYQHTWASKTFYSQIRLDRLPPESAEELLSALLGDDAGLDPLKQLLVRRGNPAFLEETVRTLVETKALVGDRGQYRLTRPVQTIQVSPTEQAVLAARIDQLRPEDKRLLQVASVIGSKNVPFALLDAVADLPEETLRNGLKSLQSGELLYETGLYPDLEYSFKHALMHEVTYGGLLRERRRALHGRIVEAIETLHRDRLGGEVERLARHAVRGEMWEKAIHYLREAGFKAAERSALPDARSWFEQALDALEKLPESPSSLNHGLEIRLELRRVLNQLGEVRQALERLREAEVLADRLNDERQRGRVSATATNLHSLLGELDEALVTGNRALEIAGRLGDVRLRILSTTYLEQAHYFRGEYERVVELATDNLAVLPADWAYENLGATAPPAINDRCWLVLSLAQLGRFAEAAEYEGEAIRLAEQTQHARTVGLAHRAAGMLRLIKGDWAAARTLSEHGWAVFRTGNVVIHFPSVVAASAWALAQLGEAKEALNQIRQAEQVAERLAATGTVGHHAWSYQALGRAALLLGRPDEARRLGDRAMEFAPRHPGFAAHALHLLGDVATDPHRFDAEAGEAHYRRALALAEPRGMRPLVAHCYLGLGVLYRRMDKREQSQEYFTAAREMYREMSMPFWLEKAEAKMSLMPSAFEMRADGLA
jgi:DNA-binding SARP family transcriptional activator/tetratricopeptide (TPR) repeat protein